MTKQQAAPSWRRAFLRALGRTGNVRVSARAAGINHGTAYAHRARDAVFAVRWERAVRRCHEAMAQRRPEGSEGAPPPAFASGCGPSPSPGNPGEEMVVRHSKRCGTQLVRAGKERWSPKAELAFLAALARTACVRRACAISGFSTTAVYNRRKSDPEFADRWRAALAAAWEEVDRVAICATLASFDPELAAADMPKVTMAELITLMRMRGFGKAAGPGAAAMEEPDIETVRARILAKIEAIEKARGREEA